MSNTQLGSDLTDSNMEEVHQLCGSSKHCPGCGHKLDGKPDWVGLPAGVKFDPTDQELSEHLEAKVGGKEMKSHPLIDEFIPTIEGEDGICYTHPEKLPGVTRDGLSRHFFHRPSKAYTTGTRKRRKIQTECDLQGGETRWHKTGKTRPVMVNGKQKGCKKILVLYTNFGKNRKPEKTNWVMHQYHLGKHEEEKEGELVVSKIFYQTQPRQCNWSERSGRDENAPANAEGSSNSNSNSNIGCYNEIDIHGFKPDQFGFLPFRKTLPFDEDGSGRIVVGNDGGGGVACDEGQHHVTGDHRRHHQIIGGPGTTSFHNQRASHSMISPPSIHTSMILDQDHSFDVSTIIDLPHQTFQQRPTKLGVGGSSASGLEELIMGCTSNDIKQEGNAEWLKYSTTFWADPDNTHHHG